MGLGADASFVTTPIKGVLTAGDDSHKPSEIDPHMFAGSPGRAYGRGVTETVAH